MAMVNPPLYLNIDGEYGAADIGLPFRFMITEGVTAVGALAVSQRAAGTNMSVDIAAGAGWVSGDDSPDSQPLYFARNDGVVNLAIAAADVTNPRIDLVVCEVRDSTFSGVDNDSRLLVVTGTPGAVPAVPATPNNALLLAEVDVAANETAIEDVHITDMRVLSSPGGELANTGKLLVICTSATRPAHAEGQPIFETDTNKLLISTGAAWVEIFDTDVPPLWTTFTPTWRSTGTAPAIGNGTLQGRYLQIGKRVDVQFYLRLGSTSTVGTGAYSWDLPVPASTTPNADIPWGFARALDDSAGSNGYRPGWAAFANANEFLIFLFTDFDTIAQVSATAPFTPANNDVYTTTFSYAAA